MRTFRVGTWLAAIAVGIAIFGAQSALAAPPPNDNFANAIDIGSGLPLSSAGHTNLEGTREAGEPSDTGPNSVWFKWTATASGLVTVRATLTCDPGIDSATFSRMFTGSAVNALAEVDLVGARDCEQTYRVTPGVHWISIANFNPVGNPGAPFDISLRAETPPPNDNYANATSLGNSLPVSVDDSTVNATWESNEPAAFFNGRSVWYTWQAPSSAQVRLDTCTNFEYISGAANRAVGVFTGNALPAAQVAVSDFGDCDVTFTPVSGTVYHVGVSVSGEANFRLRIRATTPPANDNFANYQTLTATATASATGDNTFATRETGEPTTVGGTSGADRSVWYRWVAPASGTYRVGACTAPENFSFSPRVSVYKNVALNQLATAGNRLDTSPGYGPYCRTKFTATMGTTYIVEVASTDQSGDEGPFTVDIHPFSPPANDAFAFAVDLGSALPAITSGTNIDSSTEADELNPDDINSWHSVWYRWTAPETKTYVVDLCSGEMFPYVTVWTGSNLATLTEVSDESQNSFDDCGPSAPGSQQPFPAVAGELYSIKVDGFSHEDEGDFDLTVRDPSPPSPPSGPVTSNPTPAPPSKLSPKQRCKLIKNKRKRKKCLKKLTGKKKHKRPGR